MYLLKLIYLTLLQLIKQIGALPQAVAAGARNWRAQEVVNQTEAERLDRIRNPSKYLGK